MKEKILIWLYRIFTFIVPSGIALYFFLLEKLISKNVSVTTKLGVSGVFVLIMIAVIAIFFFGKHLNKKISKTTDEIIECLDNEKKKQLILKKHKYEGKQEIFHNICFLIPFAIMYFLIVLIEKAMISLRGIMFFITISMAIGFGFNCIVQWLHSHEKTLADKDEKDKVE